MTMPPKPRKILPGEKRPLAYEHGRAVTDEEAWGVSRRLASKATQPSQQRAADEWPGEDDVQLAAYRIPTRTLWRTRARADAEGLTVTEVVRQALELWSSAPMGSELRWDLPEDPS